MICIFGPTATGKTELAANVAFKLGGEIISADSRQVFRHMNIGTGKDLEEYVVNGTKIPYHLIDIVEPGYEYSVYEFKNDFQKAYSEIISRDKIPVLCGGTGLYLEAAIIGYAFAEVPENRALREELMVKTKEELIALLATYKKIHNTSDIVDMKRLLRAIEIEHFHLKHPDKKDAGGRISSVVFGIHLPREIIRQRITTRLEKRLKAGMIDEVHSLLKSGIAAERLVAYGLEYKFLTQYISGILSYDEMFRLLNTAIHQFAKRQMTWFRRMERKGVKINWIDGEKDTNAKVSEIAKHYKDSLA
jgi:tRNA dimethylallyltransferase